MYTKRNGEDWFILNDFDLAVPVTKKGYGMGASARHRTGTLPFMAVELLQDMHDVAENRRKKTPEPLSPIHHYARFDYQSLFWVCLWCAIKVFAKKALNEDIVAAQKRSEAYLATWEAGMLQQIVSVKTLLFVDPQRMHKLPWSPIFEHLVSWFLAFRRPFWKGISAVSDAAEHKKAPRNKDMETLYNNITLDNFQESFRLSQEREAGAQTEDAVEESSSEDEAYADMISDSDDETGDNEES